MKNIITVNCDDKEFYMKIHGGNIDLLVSIAEILKKIEEQNNITVDTSMRIIKKMLEE